MLILTRIPGKSLIIGDDIKISVEGLKGENVVFRIDAPKAVCEKIKSNAENKGN